MSELEFRLTCGNTVIAADMRRDETTEICIRSLCSSPEIPEALASIRLTEAELDALMCGLDWIRAFRSRQGIAKDRDAE